MQKNDKDCIWPFFPIEMGGDGLFTHNPEFLRRILEEKKLRGSFDADLNACFQREARFRIM